MTLRTQLVIAGDASGGVSALNATDAAMEAASAEAQALAKSYAAADAAIGQLAKAQAEATHEIAATKAALGNGEIGLEQYNRQLLETKSALSLVQAEHRSAMSEFSKASVAYKAAGQSISAANDNVGGSSRIAGHHLGNLAFQFNDVAVMAASGQAPLMIFVQQGSQIAQIMAQAGVGVGGLVRELGSMVGGFLAANPLLLLAGAAMGVVAAGIGLMTDEINKNSKVHVTWSDTLLGIYDVISAAISSKVTGAFEAMGVDVGEVWESVKAYTKGAINFIIGANLALPRLIAATYDKIPAAFGDAFYSAANLAIEALNRLAQMSAAPLNLIISGFNTAFGTKIPQIIIGGLNKIGNPYAGAMSALGSAGAQSMISSFTNDWLGMAANAVSGAAQKRALARGAEEAGKGAGAAGGRAMGDKASEELEKLLAEMQAKVDQALRQGAIDFNKNLNAAWEADDADLMESIRAPGREEIDRLNEFYESLARIRDLTAEMNLGEVFGQAGEAIEGMVAAVERLQDAEDEYQAMRQQFGDDPKLAGEMAKADRAHTQAKLNGQVALLGATKRLFSEQSAGYKAIEALEKAAAIRAAINTGIHVAQGAAKIFASLGPWAFPVVGAMIAVMASLGFKGGGGSMTAPPSAKDIQEQAGTGTVLGDSSAKSNSIANSLEIVAANTNKDLEYSNAMLKALHAIEDGIGKLAGNVARQISVAGGMFDTSGAKLGSNSSGGFLGLFGSTTTRELWDAGLDIFSTSVADILQNGVEGQTFQVVQQIKKKSGFLGLGASTKTTYETTTGEIDPGITEAVNGVIYSLRQGLVEASKVIGLDGASAIIDNFRIEIGRLSFKDMTGEEIEQQLNAVFSKVGDQMAAELLPMLTELQTIGEGAFETFMRVAREYQVVDVSLRSVGLTFGAVGLSSLAARDNLVELLGGLDAFADAVTYYRENFLTEAERMAPVMSSVAAEMDRLGQAGTDTIDEFKALVNGLDLTTQAGRDLFAALMAVAPAFNTVEKYQAAQAKADADAAAAQAKADAAQVDAAKALADKRRNLEIAIMREMGNASGALAAQRSMELEAMDASLRPQQMVLYYYQDLNKARDVLTGAYQRESAALEATAAKFRDFASSLRQFRDSLFATGADSAAAQLAQLRSVGAKAARGDETALGNLSGVAQTYLDNAKGNVVSLLDYKREVAKVAQIVDGAIAGASGKASAAEQQLEVLKDQVEGQIDISDNVISVREALEKINELTAPNLESLTDSQVEANRAAADFQRDLIAAVARMDSNGTSNAAKSIELLLQLIQYFRRFEATGMPVTNVETETLAVAVAA